MDINLVEEQEDYCNGTANIQPGNTDTTVQLLISIVLGASAFLAFCFLRPRWKGLYAVRKRHLDPKVGLPTLPDSFFGWIPALYKISEETILASAGLDAFVFLSFFKMSMRIFGTLFIFAAVVLEPINLHFAQRNKKNDRTSSSYIATIFQSPVPLVQQSETMLQWTLEGGDSPIGDIGSSFDPALAYLWAYLVFTYVFTFITVFFMNRETLRVMRIRQDYLGTQSTITDRTFQLRRIPSELRTEEKIKELVENLEIGLVESVTLCKNWGELDKLIEERDVTLRKLEETWSVYLGQKPLHPIEGSAGDSATHRDESAVVDEETGENDRLLSGPSTHQFVERQRPQTRLWYGFLRLQHRQTDAIDYYEEKLHRIDEKIHVARKKTYEPASLAFVTMDSIAACQMAIQALIDPRPDQLQTTPAPAPTDVVWSNTYMPRAKRRVLTWSITIFIAILSIVWFIPVATLSSILSLCTLRAAFPNLAKSLERHDITRALVQTGLPTAVISALNIAVPYVYDILSYYQGMISRGDVQLSVISKVFFFTFFNIFLVFTVFGTVTDILRVIRQGFEDTLSIPRRLAEKIQSFSVFYLNFIILQGVGLFPFRLLEFGSIAMYPIYRMGAKTPRDFAEMSVPPVFTFAFYLPTALLIFILCLVYSVLPGGFLVLLFGVAYFGLGHFTYKYQLLYAMDQPQHSTGGAWRIICYRIVLGLVVLQLTIAGILALRKAVIQAALIVPLLIITLWYGYAFWRRFVPLTRFISLRSIKRAEDPGGNAILDEDFGGEGAHERERLRRGSTVDEDREKGLKFVNPSLFIPLERPWIHQEQPPPAREESENGDGPVESGNAGNGGSSGAAGNNDATASNSSSVSLGDTHVWRDNGS